MGRDLEFLISGGGLVMGTGVSRTAMIGIYHGFRSGGYLKIFESLMFIVYYY